MEFLSFFRKLDKEKIKLVLINGSLSIKANTEIDPQLISEIKDNKDLIIKYLEDLGNEDATTEVLAKIIPYVKDRSGRIPLSFSQERLWFLDQLEGSVAYHIPIVLRLEGALDASILEQTLQSIVSRHEVLRTILLSEDGIGYQEVISEKEWILDQVEIRDVSLFENILQDYLRIPFDLSADYKLRACLYDLGDQKYILACVFHHIASDGWSEGILVNEFMELYSALQSGRAAVLPELSLQYSDYAIWQRKYLEGAVLDSQLSYWEEKLEGVGTLSLPTDYARPSIQSTAGSNVSLTLDKNLSDSLNALCQAEGVTLFMLMLSAFKVLLSRYSGQDDICVGTSIANRTQSELEGMIGFFVNILALRSDLSGDPSFRELLERVKETTLGGYDHQLAPFEKVVDRMITARDMSMSPLFQVLFVLHNTPEESGKSEKDLEGVKLSGYEFDSVTSKSDLTLNASEGDSGLILTIEYCTALFDKSTIDRMLLHYKELLISILGDITQPVGTLSMLSAEEEEQLLNIFNDTELIYPEDKTIVDLFEEQVKSTPEAIALVYEDQVMTYKELDDRSNQLVHYFESVGMVEDSRIGILFNRSFDMIISILGVLKSGCTYVPLDPSLPSKRLSYILEDSSVNFLLYKEESLLSNLSVSEFIFFLDIAESLALETSKLSYTINPVSVAYIMYTSGTTGNPKGVMITHNNIVSLCKSCDYISLNSDTVWLSTGSISFDATTLEFFGTLLNGGQLILADTSSLLNIVSLRDLIIKHSVTTMWMTASWFHQIVEDDICVFENLTDLLVGGDVVLFAYTNKLKEHYPELHIVNGYGPTENTTFSTTYSIDEVTYKNLPIGKPIKNSQAYILDSKLELLPIGVVGELCVGGSGLGRGYLNQEELTREKFIENPFKEGDIIYKTGDLARWLSDGTIEFIGRKDDQVKIRGYRIELGEIENVLSSIAGIIHCCVLAKEDTVNSKRLIGYVVVEDKLDRAALQEQLKLSLPEYMVPMIWVELAELPLTSNGKLDKKALPDPDGLELYVKEYVAPVTDTEHQLVQIWENLLGVEKVGVHDNFFELGGHSLLATRLVSMIRKELSIEVEIADVFEYTTIAMLSSHVSVQSKGVLLPAIVVQEKEDRTPLSFSQERLWFLDQLQGSSSEYHIPTVLHLEGALDTLILEQTLQSIVSRHEVLRTILLSEDGIGYQEVISEKEWILDQVVISDRSLFENILQDYLMAPFDLSADYKLRACLYDLGDQKYILACVLHHIASDGWSGGILVNEFMEFYSALQSGRAAVLPELSLQYSDYAIWQRKYLEGAVLDSQLSYWEEKLEGVGTLSLPTDYARPSIQSTAGSNVSLTLDKNLSDSLNALCQAEGVTLFMLMLSAFKVLLSRYSGQDDICVGTPIANRTQSELEGMIGFFVNTLALRSDLSGNPDFRELLKRVKETTLGSYDHQLAPFEKVVDRVVTTRDMSMSPLFQVMFVLQNTPKESEEVETGLEGILLSGYEFENVTSQFDLILNVSEGNNGIGLDIVYCTDLFDRATIDRMMLHYKELLVGIVSDITRPISIFPMLTVNEEHQLLYSFNDTAVAYPKDKTVVDLFEEQVKKTPDAIAVVYEGETLSYKELDEKSNQLANYLLTTISINSQCLIGVVLERSDWLIISFLAILKTGSVYVPIDLNYPEERKEYIKKDSGCSIIIDDLYLSLFKDTISDYAVALPRIVIKSDDLAYVIYTSGSTGQPKGVMIEHKSIINTILSQISAFSITNIDSSLQFASPSFDASISEICISLLSGCRLCIIKEEEKSNIEFFRNFIVNNTITIATLPPAFLQLLSVEDLKGIKTLVTAGESIPLALAKRFSQDYNYINAYGPTEASICSTIFREDIKDLISIGKPIDNTSAYIMNDSNQLLPIGVVGELCIGGSGVARGYLNKEELTLEKFIENPFKEGDRIYKTGDLARWLSDGNLEFIGRKDNQVKIRGYRIELGEIENVLSSVRGISQCCVLAKEDSNDTKRLVGYVVSEGKLDKSYLEDQLKLSLPEYMVPMIWVELAEMPLTSNGKLDRKALPDVDSSDLSRKEYVAPRSDTEKQLAEIWQSLLGLEKVGVYDNFFELGGHSLLAVQLISRLQKLGFHIGVKDIFSGPTIALISDKLSSLSLVYSVPVNGIRVDSDYITPSMVPLIDFNQSDLDELVGMVAGGVSNIADIYPLSPLQEGIYFHHLMSDPKAGDPYVLPSLLSFPDNDKRNCFIEALQFVVNRHDVLRTCILSFGLPQAVQVVLREAPLSLEHLVLDNSRAILSQLEVLIAPGSHWMDISKAPLLELKSADDSENDCYYLIVYQHHLIMDHVGLEKIVSEVMLYLSGNQESLGVPVLYRDFIGHTLHAQSEHDAGSYFRSLFEGIEEPTYPFDLSNILGDGKGINEFRIVLPKVLSSELRETCLRLGMTPAVLFHAAYGLVVARCSNKDYAVFGSLFSGRLQGSLGAADSLGLFINTLPVLVELKGSVLDYLDQVKVLLRDLLSYEQTPLSHIQNWSGISNDMAFFSALLNYRHSSPVLSHEDHANEFDSGITFYGGKERTNYPFTLSVDDYGDDFELKAQIDGSIDASRIVIYIKNALVELLEGLKREDLIINALNILSKEEEYQLQDVFNDTAIAYSKDKTLVDLFEDQVKRTPDATAIVFEDQVITYKELDERSNQLVHYFESVGMVEDSRIGILFNRSFDMIISILGVLKSGCTYVPLDPSLPSKRLSYILEDSNVNFILYKEESLLSSFPVLKYSLLNIAESLNYESSKVEKERGYDSVAYIMYTSGTTGVPKGISINDENIITLINDPLSKISVNNLDRVLQWSNYAFDGSTYEIFGSLLNGACLYLIDKSTASDAGVLSQVISKNELSVVFITTALFNSLAEYDLSLLSSLRLLLFGGEKVSVSPVKKILSALGPDKILHVYGPTETTVYATCYEICEISDDAETIPIGKPLSNTSLYILDSKLELLPIGVVGELCVGGSGVGRGYLNQEELTREKFIENPFKEGDIIYKTGDLARWLADGTVEFIGRKDDQVKIRGYRIELGEIEKALSSVSGIIHCCVLAKEDTVNSKRLIGYVVVEGKLDRAALQEQLKLSLPEYMVPMIWVELAELPLTSNGKLDKKALPDPDSSDLSTKEYVAPGTETEHQLVQIWENLLGIEKVGVHDNFFELGGHSLLATRLVSIIRKELSIEISIREVFEYTTISALAVHVSVQSEGVLLPTIAVQEKEDRIPLSFSQERLWFLDQLEGSVAYHIPIVLRLEGALDTSILEQTLQSIVSRHEVLRTILLSEDGIGYQEVISEKEWSLDQVVISDRSLFENILQDYLRIPFDLSADYKLRACLYDLGDQKYILACVFHHIASDGWSGGILVNEFMELYSALQSGRAAVLPELSLQYSDYAIWQRKYLEGAVLDSQLSYWEEKLEGVGTLSLPTDYARPSIQSTAGSNVSLTLDKNLSDSLNALCQAEGVTLFMLMLSAFKVLLSRYSGQDDICVGTPIANRTQSELEGMIGFFVNTLALRSDLSGNPDFRELLKRVKETTLGSYDHQLAPFEKVVDRVVTTRDMSMSPLFQVMFVLQNTPKESEEVETGLEGILLSGYEFEHVTSQFDLILNVSEGNNGIGLDIVYCTDLFDRATIDRMMLHYKELLVGIVSDITRPISILPMLTVNEEHELLYSFNDTAVAYPKDKTVVDLFEEQVKKTPDAIAVVYEGEALSYKELDEKSNQLGHYLIEQGVEPDTLVGICLERSLEMLIGILGILKSGGAYVPVDPDYPSDRIGYMLGDASIKLVLSMEDNHKILADYKDIDVLLLDKDWEKISVNPTTGLNVALSPSHLAYVIYTSGSTGKPKGVMNEHGGIVNRLLWTQSHYKLRSEDTILQKTSFSFDVSVWELLWSVTCGSRLVFAKAEGHRDAIYLKRIIEEYSITTIHFVPSMLSVFLSFIEPGDCSSLERVLCSGEALQLDQIVMFKEKFSQARLDNLYGPTEAAIDVSSWEVPLKDSLSGVLIGQPVDNTSLYVVDDSHQLLPIGVAGELCIGGIQVARGYLNQKELTREKFIENPFKEGDRIYKTGDLARWLPDGTIEYIGRKDNQVKIRGYRIELGEIENVLSSVRGISQCCVLAKEDSNDTKRLVGYVVSEGKLDKSYLEDQLKLSLPEYMVPMIWVELTEMPLTSNGKLDRKALPDVDSSDLSRKEYVAPRSDTEKQLAEIWQSLLGLEKVGVYDNFFELGGHSLLAVQLISRLQKLGFHIGVKDIFSGPTIALISDKLSSLSLVYSVPVNGIRVDSDYITPSMVPLIDFNQSDLDELVGMVAGGVSNIADIYPLSPLQEGIYFHHLMSDPKAGDPYVLPSLLSFPDNDKRNFFIEALQFVVNRHDVLRTCILSFGLPQAVQVVLREAPLSLEHLVLDNSRAILSQLEVLIAPGSHWMDISKAPLLELKSADDSENDCYYLIVYQHHLIMDHVGLEKIVSEVMLYLSGNQESLGVPVLYRDFIGHTLHAQSEHDAGSYFRSLFEGIEEPTYPFDLSNILGDGKDIEESEVLLSKALSSELRETCLRLGMTPAVLFHAAYGLVVARCSNKDYAVFGSLFSGRLQGSLGAADSLGLFINTLPVLVELKGSVLDYLDQVKVLLRDLLSYEQTPLSHIQNWSGISNDMAFFSALLNYRHSSPVLSHEDHANEFDSGITVLSSHERTNYPFTLSVDDYGDDFGLKSQIDQSIGSQRIVEYMKEALTELLEAIKSGESSVMSLVILPKEEQHELLYSFNDTAVAYPKDKTVVDLFEEQVKKTPDAIAVVYEGEALSYKELDEKSNQLGHYLIEQGVEPDTLVGICLERSLEMLIGILGILKSGGAYVPVDPDYPSDRIGYMLGDAGIKLVLSMEDNHKILADYKDIDVLLLDKDWEKISVNPTTALNVALSPSHLAYVIYTSGSTGKPKGVMIEHSSLVNFLLSMINRLEMQDLKSFLSVTTNTFDIFYLEFFAPLLLGAKVIVLNSISIRDGDQLQSAIANHSPDFMQATPSTWQMLIDNGWDNRENVTLLSGGETIKESLKDSLTSISNNVWNLYGPTEATIWITAQKLNILERVIIGKEIDNVQLYILDNYDNILPLGLVGELCIGGIQVARGYLNQEELTREKFIENPFKEGDRIYKTGDLARWLPDGNLEFIGRKDNQVKIRGYRIELGEIENVLSSVRGISQCCVLAKEDSNDTKRLVGYVVVEGKLDRAALQEQLKLSLPEYMVPMIWVELEEMPLTSNGKLDRKALPDPNSSDLSTKEYVAPRTETEQQLVQIWENLLGVEKVGVHDNFFELGGHSLLATRLVSIIRKELSIEISIREVFEYTTIATLSSHVSSQSAGILLPAVIVENRPQQIPLSFSQERLWFLDQLQGSLEYHMPIALRLEGALDASILEQTLQSIVSRHEVLRTILLSEDGIGYQEVISEKEWILDQVVISDKSLFENILQDYLMTPFDLSADYKLRACLYDLGDQKYILACVMHHIASDGWSGGILVNEFMELYSALQSGRAAVLPELSLQYSDYAIWQRKYLEGAVLDSQLSYWEEKLEGVGTLSLPTDYARPSIQSTAGSNVSLTLDKNLSDSLNALCQAEGVTLFMLMLSAFKVLLSRYSGQDDICVGTPIANRTQSELEGMIGFFVNTLALRSDLSGNPDFRELLKRVKETTLGSYDHQLAPFEKVVDRVVTTRDMSMSPLFQVMFVLQNALENSGKTGKGLEGVTLSGYEFDTFNSKVDLTLTVSENNDGIIVGIVYCTALFDRATIDRMLLHYKELLLSIVIDIDQPVGSLSMLTKEEEYQLLHLFNDTTVAYPKDKTIVDLFEEQVKKTPDAIAVVYEGETLSYRELNEKSNQLGHYLREQGVEPDTLVGICLERSLEMLIGILGILKSGGAYVPVDPDYPSDRIGYMLVDAGIKLVLSREDSHKILADYKDIAVLLLDKDWAKISVNPTTALNVALSPSHLAYVIYTSGSTGNPKGVLISHSNVVRLFKNESYLFDFGTNDVWTLFHSFCFDFSVWEMYGALLHGGRLVVVPKAVTKDAISFKELLISEGVTVLNQTPGSFYALQQEFLTGGFNHSLRYVIFGGEALNPIYLKDWKASYVDCKMINMYGITETTVHVTYKELNAEDMLNPVSMIGSAIPTLGCYILDDNLNLVPVGVIGELCVGGAGVARGYLNREELTREKFIENPFVATDRLYRSGDLGRWLADGNIEYIGRKDNQVKIRGYRIELGEIENVLSSIPGINQCCVLAKADAGGNKRLVGYVVSEGKLDKGDLQQQLKLSLPEYMVPMIWVELEEIPLTSNGKLDRKALPDPDSSDLSTKEYVGPRTDTEKQLTEIWQNLLGVEKVGIYDNFFELGGHSLLVTRLVSIIRDELSVEISIREIFKFSTVDELSSYLHYKIINFNDSIDEYSMNIEL